MNILICGIGGRMGHEVAKLALEGYETAPDCLYFASNAVAPRCWAGRNRQVALVIGGHTFFY